MKISAINYQTNPIFTGENNHKPNKLKSLAGATIIAIAASAPLEDSDAQIIPYTPIFNYPTYSTTANSVNTPKCFRIGDISENYEDDKSLPTIFNEIDKDGNGTISVDEVIETERNNWQVENGSSYTTTSAKNVTKRFEALAKVYNDINSNPNTINYDEYKEIMSDCQTSEALKYVPVYPNPYYYTLPPAYYYRPHRPHIHHAPPPPPRHHHHDYHRY